VHESDDVVSLKEASVKQSKLNLFYLILQTKTAEWENEQKLCKVRAGDPVEIKRNERL